MKLLGMAWAGFVMGCALICSRASFAVDAAPLPLRVLLITGCCCHDYARQKDILKEGIEERGNIEVTQIHTSDGSTKARFDLY